MTREENLHWIDQEIQTWENECQSKHPIKEALYAARKALEQEPCEDAVSRKSVITIIQNHWWNCRDIDKLVSELPSVTPQESFINKPCVSSEVCEHDKQKVLDKIRAEVKALSPAPTAYDVVDGNPVKDAVWEIIGDVLQIIDKYKSESGVEDDNDN